MNQIDQIDLINFIPTETLVEYYKNWSEEFEKIGAGRRAETVDWMRKNQIWSVRYLGASELLLGRTKEEIRDAIGLRIDHGETLGVKMIDRVFSFDGPRIVDHFEVVKSSVNKSEIIK